MILKYRFRFRFVGGCDKANLNLNLWAILTGYIYSKYNIEMAFSTMKTRLKVVHLFRTAIERERSKFTKTKQ